MGDFIHHFKTKKSPIGYIYFNLFNSLTHTPYAIQILDERKFYQHYRVHAGSAAVRTVLIHYKVIDKIPVNGFINDPQKMVPGNHVIHAEHLNLFSFLICILSHHRSIPPFFGTSIIPEKSQKVPKIKGIPDLLYRKIRGGSPGLCLQSEMHVINFYLFEFFIISNV